MKIFIDSANVEAAREMFDLGIIDGATTNPTLIAREKRPFRTQIDLLLDVFGADGIVFAEATALDYSGMVAEALELAAISDSIIVKIPMCPEGIKAVKTLRQKGVRTAVTLVFNAAQALLAAKAGAHAVAPFVGRLDDIGHCGLDVIKEIADVFAAQKVETKILVASLKQPWHVIQAAKYGAEYLTIPYPVLKQCLAHPLSQEGIDLFMKDWEDLQAKLSEAPTA